MSSCTFLFDICSKLNFLHCFVMEDDIKWCLVALRMGNKMRNMVGLLLSFIWIGVVNCFVGQIGLKGMNFMIMFCCRIKVQWEFVVLYHLVVGLAFWVELMSCNGGLFAWSKGLGSKVQNAMEFGVTLCCVPLIWPKSHVWRYFSYFWVYMHVVGR